MQLPMLPADKANHYIYGQVIYGVALFVLHWIIKLPLHVALGWAMLAVVVLAGGKEWWDREQNRRDEAEGRPKSHGVEVWDAVATSLGGASIWLLFLTIWGV